MIGLKVPLEGYLEESLAERSPTKVFLLVKLLVLSVFFVRLMLLLLSLGLDLFFEGLDWLFSRLN